jgi:hypothetical protein
MQFWLYCRKSAKILKCIENVVLSFRVGIFHFEKPNQITGCKLAIVSHLGVRTRVPCPNPDDNLLFYSFANLLGYSLFDHKSLFASALLVILVLCFVSNCKWKKHASRAIWIPVYHQFSMLQWQSGVDNRPSTRRKSLTTYCAAQQTNIHATF